MDNTTAFAMKLAKLEQKLYYGALADPKQHVVSTICILESGTCEDEIDPAHILNWVEILTFLEFAGFKVVPKSLSPGDIT